MNIIDKVSFLILSCSLGHRRRYVQRGGAISGDSAPIQICGVASALIRVGCPCFSRKKTIIVNVCQCSAGREEEKLAVWAEKRSCWLRWPRTTLLRVCYTRKWHSTVWVSSSAGNEQRLWFLIY